MDEEIPFQQNIFDFIYFLHKKEEDFDREKSCNCLACMSCSLVK